MASDYGFIPFVDMQQICSVEGGLRNTILFININKFR